MHAMKEWNSERHKRRAGFEGFEFDVQAWLIYKLYCFLMAIMTAIERQSIVDCV